MARWTNEQKKAIETRGGNLIVSAAAGSGKTAVLVERVCNYLVHLKGDLNRLLVVTFTEAAANEMRQRIGTALQERLAATPNDRHLARQLALLPRAPISTIHSFCLWLLRRYFYRLDLDPAFRVMDEGEDRLLKLEVLDALLEAHYQEEPPGSPFYTLVDRYSDQRGEKLESLLLSLYNYAQSQVFPATWLHHAVVAFAIPPDAQLEQLRWYDVLRNQCIAEVQGAKAALEVAVRLAEQPAGPEHYRKVLTVDLAALSMIEQTLESGTWDQVSDAFGALDFPTARASRSQSSADIDDHILERVKSLRDDVKKNMRALREQLFTRSVAQMLDDLRAPQVPVQALVDLIHEFATRYQQAKQARGWVNFADLERLSLQLLLDSAATPESLIPSETALELQTQFDEVLCDEYQDINPVQDAILGLVAGEYGQGTTHPGTFRVGDVKQSIYRFRLAEPRIFLKRCQQAAEGEGALINLAANFRCRHTVVEAVNELFYALMSDHVGDVTYNEDAALVFQAEYPATEQEEAPVEVLLLEGDPRLLDDARRLSGRPTLSVGETPEADDDTDRPTDIGDDVDLTALEREASLIARRICSLVQGDTGAPYQVWDKHAREYRPIRYRDVVVLLRATQMKASQFVDIFRREGVPLYAETGSGYFQAPEIESMLALLSVIDNPRQDIPLAGVLRSPLVGLTAGDLADSRLSLLEGEFYDAIQVRAALNDALGQKLTAFLTQLDAWRTLARRGALAELVWSIYRDTGFYDYCGGLPGGGQRQANLRALYDRARQFDQFARHGLVRYLQYINDLRAAGEDLGTAPALGENEDVVRLMSIHKSKGLEFPVVFVAGLGTQFNQQDLNGALLYDRELGLGPQIVDSDQHTKADTLASLGVRESIRRAGLSEEMRILYVALTRARERLFLVGTINDVVTTLERWSHTAQVIRQEKRMPEYLTVMARRFIDWIGPVLSSRNGLIPTLSFTDADADVCIGTAPGWRVCLYPPAAVVRTLETEGSTVSWADPLREVSGTLAEDTRQRLTAQLAWSYPWVATASVAAKTNVTELKRRAVQVTDPENPTAAPFQRAAFRRPAFLIGDGKLTATEIGTATHQVLQHIPLQSPVTPQVVSTCITGLVAQGFLTTKEGEAVDQSSINRFFASPLGCRLQQAGQGPDGHKRVRREEPFSLAIPVCEMLGSGSITNQADTLDAVMLQGVIDCLFWEPDGWVLLDFKTDRLPTGDTLEVMARERYSTQISWYARAAMQVCGIHIKECALFLLAHGIAIPIKPDLTLIHAV